MSTFVRAVKPTPVLNCPDFQGVFGKSELPLDEKGLLRPLEMIALVGTLFSVCNYVEPNTLEVKTDEYPSETPLYIDSRFVESTSEHAARDPTLPPRDHILHQLESCLGLPYIWGGNWSRGIPEIRSLYNPDLDPNREDHHLLKGVDCSGLLYEATNGFTPRNTSQLLLLGKPISSFSDVKPLDILIWPGHVVICLTEDLIIESLYGKGVITTPLAERQFSFPENQIKIISLF